MTNQTAALLGESYNRNGKDLTGTADFPLNDHVCSTDSEEYEGIWIHSPDTYSPQNSKDDMNNERNIESEGQEELDDGRTNDDQSSTCDSDISLESAPSLSSCGSGARTFQDYDSQDSTTNDTRSYSDIELGDAPLLSLSSFYESSSDDS